MSDVVPSVCPLDCPDRCSLDVTVDDGRVLAVGGSRKNPLTEGYICSKVAKFGRRVHGPERVLWPAVRVGPKGPGAKFERVTWDHALGVVADRFRAIIAESGPEALLPYWYGGSNGYLTGGGLDARLWARLGTTKIERTLCATNAGAAATSVYADLPGADPADVRESRGVVLWGVNPHASGVHLVPAIKHVLDQGGPLLLVDPRQTPFANKAAVHLRPLPGTDVAIALALGHLAFARGWADRAFLAAESEDAAQYEAYVAAWTPERAAKLADVPVADLEEFAELYAATSPAMLRCGWGVERTRNGTDAIRAILALPAVYGKFGRKGGGYAMSTSAGYRFDKSKIAAPHAARSFNMSKLGEVLATAKSPPIRGVYVYDCNPVATVPDQGRVIEGLAKDDMFVVVHEQVWNDTTDYADVVLPATTFLEHHELTRSYGGYLLQWATPAIPPVGESRPNHAVFQDLAERLGLPDVAAVTEEDLVKAVISGVPAAPEGTWETLQTERYVKLPSLVQYVDVVPSRKIRLISDDPPRYREPPVDADRPLILISPASSRGISSTLFETLAPGEARVSVHPDDAAKYGLVDGARVRVHNSVGSAELLAHVDPSQRPGVVMIPKGTWRRSTKDGFTGNALVPAHVDERGGGACYNDARVSIEGV